MRALVTVLTDRGQVSLPAAIRKALNLKPGQKLRWQRVSDTECRVLVQKEDEAPGPLAVLGYARNVQPGSRPRSTAAWMKELRAGDKG